MVVLSIEVVGMLSPGRIELGTCDFVGVLIGVVGMLSWGTEELGTCGVVGY